VERILKSRTAQEACLLEDGWRPDDGSIGPCYFWNEDGSAIERLKNTMAINIKAATRLIEIETGLEWRIERRTRGKDGDSGDPSRPLQTWVVILKNAMGHKQFIPESRLATLFRPYETPAPVAAEAPVEATSDSA